MCDFVSQRAASSLVIVFRVLLIQIYARLKIGPLDNHIACGMRAVCVRYARLGLALTHGDEVFVVIF